MRDLPRLTDDGNSFERALLASAHDDALNPEHRAELFASVEGRMASIQPMSFDSVFQARSQARSQTGSLPYFERLAYAGLQRAMSRKSAVWLAAGSAALAIAIFASAPSTPATPSVSTAPAAIRAERVSLGSASKRVETRSSDMRSDLAGDLGNESPNAELRVTELQVVDRAYASLAAGQSHEALATLDEYRARFPHGALADEAAVLRIEALARTGEEAKASNLARAFLSAHPHSPYAARAMQKATTPSSR